MAVIFELPPADYAMSLEALAYFARFVNQINDELESINQVIVRDAVPENPREGRIYYLTEDLNDDATEGYYVYVNNVWNKLAMTPVA